MRYGRAVKGPGITTLSESGPRTPAPVVALGAACHNPTMAIVETEPEGRGPNVVIATVVVLLLALALLFYGLAGLHWFGFNSPPAVGTAPSVTPAPAASPSESATASASASASP